MKEYNHKKIEKKWQEYWIKKDIYKTEENSKKPKSYVLDMFPYPSGEGLHVGHPKGYIATDIYSRYKKMSGYNVLHPMGWDAFGLPAENFAIKNKVHPRVAVEKNIKRFKEQLSVLGFNYDWEREINTTDPEYYKWTQWIFLKMFEKGLAHESYEPINWCPKCKTGLANEDLEGDKCERCGTKVEQKPMRQWVLKITDYADRMLEDLNELEWSESIKESQRNWIGKSEGAEIEFKIKNNEEKEDVLILHGWEGSSKSDFIPELKKDLKGKGHNVFALDMLNTETPNFDEWFEFVEEKIRKNNLNNFSIVGYSMGGHLALKLAEKYKIKKLILVSPVGFNKPNSKYFLQFKNKLAEDDLEIFKNYQNRNLNEMLIKKNAYEINFIFGKDDIWITKEVRDFYIDKFEDASFSILEKKGHLSESEGIKKVPEIEDIFNDKKITVFTTRPDTLFGATYCVLAPEHKLVQELKKDIENWDELAQYIAIVKDKSDIERTAEGKEKTGVELKGVKAINPVNGEEIPIFIADYVLAHYGTGVIMAVPAHDERDFEFAKKFGLEIKEVILPERIDKRNPPVEGKKSVERQNVHAIVCNPKNKKILCLKWKNHPWITFPMGGVDDEENVIDAAHREVTEETGYKNLVNGRVLGGQVRAEYFAAHKDENRIAYTNVVMFDLADEEQIPISEEESSQFDTFWMNMKDINVDSMTHAEMDVWLDRINNGEKAYVKDGVLTNSDKFDGMDNEKAKKAITEFVGGKLKTTYKLRDWVFSRQRYWGEPIPIIHCEKCGVLPVPEDELPVILPDVKSYEPTGTGESPLAGISEWVNVNCPKCGGKGKRETNTMPQWAGSSWYYLRYVDPKNKEKLVDKDKEKYWSPVDMYVGGAEHATRHLIYARFWHKFLYDIGVVNYKEPFKRLKHVGLIMAEDGRKMSKRYGNVINPDDIVNTYGADTMRLYEMFMGPFDQSIMWSENNILGPRRFIEKIWRLKEKIHTDGDVFNSTLNQTIKKVGNDIEEFKFNTAISQMMILVNEMEKAEKISQEDFESLLKILTPFTPHITEELWEELGHKISIYTEDWPKYDDNKIKEDKTIIVVQVDGKVRGSFEIDINTDEKRIKEMAVSLDVIKKWINDKEISKIIYVKNRMVSIVTN